MNKKVMVMFGTRPEAIKMAPLIEELNKSKQLDCVVLNTAQQREQTDQVLELFGIKPDYDLDLMNRAKGLIELNSKGVPLINEVILAEKPDLVLVHGDTNTTLMGAQATFYNQIPVVHIEAGLRTNDIYSPFPEEMNRRLVSRIASYHFAPTAKNKVHLLEENFSRESVFVVGNTVIDALQQVVKIDRPLSPELDAVLSNGKRTILFTSHRRENIALLKGVYEALNEIIETYEDVQIIFPVHLNPAVREQVKAHLKENERVVLLNPLDYYEFSRAMAACNFVVTDSGGVQEEAPSLKKPVLVIRNETERTEGVESGVLSLVGTKKELILEEMRKLLDNEEAYEEFTRNENPYGDGTTSQKIVQTLEKILLK